MKKEIIILITFLMLASLVYAANTIGSITINSPATALKFATRSPTINVTVEGNGTSYECNLYSNDTSTWQKMTGETYIINNNSPTLIQNAQFNQGSILWNLGCNNTHINFINFSSSNITSVIDVDPPVITLTSPADNNLFSGLTFSTSLTVTDSNNASCDLYVNDSKVNSSRYTSGSAFTLNWAAVNGSRIQWKTICNDTVGNTAETPLRFAHMNYVPAVILNAPADASSESDGTIDFNVTTIGHGDQYNCYIYTNDSGSFAKNGANSIVLNDTPTIITRHIANSHVVWNAECVEIGIRYPFVSSYSGANRTLTIDSGTPSVTTNSPADNFYSSSETTTVSLTVTDDNPSVCFLNVNGTKNASKTSGITSGTAFTIQLNASPGAYLWNSVCNDTAGNTVTTANRTLFVDTTAPTKLTNNTKVVGSCREFGLNITFDEVANLTIEYGLSANSKTYSDSVTTFATEQVANLTFNFTYETDYFVNYTFCDQAGNCNSSNFLQVQSPVSVCSGWNLWSVYDTAINFSDLFTDTTADFVYHWNESSQSWVWQSDSTTTYESVNLGIGDEVFLYNAENATWFRNDTGRNIHNYRVNITSGHNFLGAYHPYTFGNLSATQWVNKTLGNITPQNFAFVIEYTTSFNNSAQSFVSHIKDWSTNNGTRLGSVKNGLDVIHIFSDYNITLNMTASGKGFVYANWSG